MNIARSQSSSPADPDASHLSVLVVEDHQLVADGLRAALRLNDFDVVMSTCTTGTDILDEARKAQPCLVLLDLDLGSAGSGSDLVAPLVRLGAKVLVLTGVIDRVELARCLEAGALAVVSKTESFSSVLDKIRRAEAGEAVTSESERARYMVDLQRHRMDRRAIKAPFNALTTRERHVLGMIVKGASARTIARESFVSVATVRTQIRAILQKLDVKSQIAAAAMARTAGWRPDESPIVSSLSR
jgi:two-component system nitrate/nitrite response regulator NarL